MTALTLANYKTEVTDFSGTVILFFHAPWDTPGLKTAKFLRSLPIDKDGEFKVALGVSTHLECVKLFSVDYDSERELVQKFSVRELPIVYRLKDGEVVSTKDVCETTEQLEALLEEK